MVVLLLLQIFYVTQTDSVRKMFSSFLAINMVVLFFFFFLMLTVLFHQKQRKDRFKSIVLSLLVTVWLYIRLVNLSGGVEKNPSPKS